MTNEKAIEFREKDLRLLYKFLGHQGHYSRVGSLDYKTGKYEQEFISGEEEFITYARRYNGSRNIFIGRGFRDSNGHVLGCRAVSFDIDPLHSDGTKRLKGEPSNDEEHSRAISAGRRILSRYPGGYLASSGNGALLVYSVPGGIPDLAAHYRKEAVFIETLQRMVEDLNVHIDKTSYDEAIIKAIGTFSTKGDLQNRRCSRFLTPPIAPYREARELLRGVDSITNQENGKVLNFEGDPVKRISKAKESLNQISKEKANEYDSWLKVGMALKEFGIAGLALWKEWSKQSEKYEEGICEKKWETFNETPEFTIASLIKWAKEDGRQNAPRAIQTGKASYFDQLFQPHSESDRLIRTGIASLDACIQQMPRGEITSIAARTGFGKTSLALTIAEHLRATGYKVLYFSTEMQLELIMHKLIASACNIELEKLLSKTFTEAEGKRIRAYQQELLRADVVFNTDYRPTIQTFRDEIETHNPDLVIFDHINHVAEHWELLSQYLKNIKEIVSEKGIACLNLCELNEPGRNKDGKEAESIRGDVRGSHDIIIVSALFMYLSNPYDVKTEFQPVDIHIAKNRYGLSGVIATATVNKKTGFFMNREEKEDDKSSRTGN